MFGFSLAKLLVLAAIIAAVWYGFKIIGRRNQSSKVAGNEPESPRISAEDTIECTRCGTYVVVAGAVSCGRADCPYPS
jgi:uncharacterized protein